jgi:probable phosphoglycerate mutase
MRVILVRHGQSEWNASRRLQGQADIELSEKGRAQAGALRPALAEIGIGRVIASDLKRVRQTAEALGAEAPTYTPALREIDVGEWTGRDIDELRAEAPEAYQDWRAGTFTPPKGEGWADFTARASSAIERERARPVDNLLAVCHGGVIRALLHYYLGIEPRGIIPAAPASLTAFRLPNGTGPARLELFNFRPGTLDFDAPD